MVGAKAYLYGEIKGSGSPYTISVDVLKTDSNDKLTSIEETAEGKEQIAAAISRIASRVRADMGESEHSVTKTSLPLDQEASSDVAALQAYAAGEDALESGRIGDAIRLFEEAKTLPIRSLRRLICGWPGCISAERAEMAAASEAKLAQDTSERRERSFEAACSVLFRDELERRLQPGCRGDEAVQGALSAGPGRECWVWRGCCGRRGIFLRHCRRRSRSLARIPYSSDAYSEAEIAMTGMDRFQGVLQLQEQAQRLGVIPGGITACGCVSRGRCG